MSDLTDEPTSAYPTLSSELPYRSGRVIDVRADRVEMPDGGQATRDVVVHPGAVGIIAMDDQERILLLQQYRHPVRRLLWEPPAGLLDEAGEDPLDAAKRELYEEAHLEADRWDVLVDAFTSPGMTDEAVRIYLARSVRASSQPKFEAEHEEADMPTRWVPLADAVAAVLDGRIHNPLGVMGVLAANAAGAAAYRGLRSADAAWPEMSSYPGSAKARS
ncbi:MAG TPA: NUDIX hydrolase [Mycobacteriales bacterium]|nr:NUDIX hydrolase [Mycobacteriales bacterium]